MQVDCDPELNELLKRRQQVQVLTNGRDATPRTLRLSDLLEFQYGDGLDKGEEVLMNVRQFDGGEIVNNGSIMEDEENVQADEDFDEITKQVRV